METGGRLTTPLEYSLLSELYKKNSFNPQDNMIFGKNNKRRRFNYRLNHRIKNVVEGMFNGRLPSHHLHIMTQEEYERHNYFSIVLGSPTFTDV